MLKSKKYEADLVNIQRKIKNLQEMEFNLQQKIEKLKRFPHLDSELPEVQQKGE